MGSDRCTLQVGAIYYEWLDYLPDYLLFMFAPDEWYSQTYQENSIDESLETETEDEEEEDENEEYSALGYRTSCSLAKLAFDKLGYNLAFVSGIYEHFEKELKEEFESLSEPFALRKQDITAPTTDALNQFIQWVRKILAHDFSDTSFSQPYDYNFHGLSPVSAEEYFFRRNKDCADFTSIQEYAIQNLSLIPPDVIKVLLLFSDWRMFEYADVLALSFCRLLLECVEPSDEAKMELRDFVANRKELRELHSNTPWRLTRKIDLYNQLFRMFSTHEPDIRLKLAKRSALDNLAEAQKCKDSNKKGKLFEDVLVQLFQSNNELTVEKQRYDTEDQEIDIILKNNVSRPFWIQLNSPLIFVECKNWTSPVGAKECRDFEVKLLNQNAFTKLGFFIAANESTNEFKTALQRMSRGEKTIVLIEGKELVEFCMSDDSLLDWLEKKICAFV
ncbi:MAG: restriction endonuclease [Candidatus Obscuribacterales bacterium]|nr:restriction endonuclease [Candidatus Obscuribacterales bacterium]